MPGPVGMTCRPPSRRKSSALGLGRAVRRRGSPASPGTLRRPLLHSSLTGTRDTGNPLPVCHLRRRAAVSPLLRGRGHGLAPSAPPSQCVAMSRSVEDRDHPGLHDWRRGGITINDPEQGNSHHSMRDRIADLFDDASASLEVRSVVLSAAGDRHFCTGAHRRPASGHRSPDRPVHRSGCRATPPASSSGAGSGSSCHPRL